MIFSLRKDTESIFALCTKRIGKMVHYANSMHSRRGTVR